MRFSEIVGHDRVKDVLMRSVLERRIGHAYVFEGPKGVGRLSTAKAFAQVLICENPTSVGACGECANCKMCANDSHPDVRIISNQLYDSSKKSTDILVDTVRNMKNEIYIKPYSAERKVYIVPCADTMNVYAQNSLLKVLEEPPRYCTIILIAENSDMFLPTILSRTVTLHFGELSSDEVCEYIHRLYPELDMNSVNVKANICGGSIGKALELVGDSSAEDLRKEAIGELVNLLNKGRRSIYDFTLFLKRNKNEISFIMSVMKSFFRDLMRIKSLGEDYGIINSDIILELKNFNENVSEKSTLRFLEILFKYEDYFSKNLNYATAVQCMSMELWEEIHDRGYRS